MRRIAAPLLVSGLCLATFISYGAVGALADKPADPGAQGAAHSSDAPGQIKKNDDADDAGDGAQGEGSGSTADSGPGASDQGCDGSHHSNTGNGANTSGAYDNTCDGSPSENGEGDGAATGKPCAGCVGNADDKNPPGQHPDGSDHNAGYECDRNKGIGQSNPAHTGCTSSNDDSDDDSDDDGDGGSDGDEDVCPDGQPMDDSGDCIVVDGCEGVMVDSSECGGTKGDTIGRDVAALGGGDAPIATLAAGASPGNALPFTGLLLLGLAGGGLAGVGAGALMRRVGRVQCADDDAMGSD